MQGMQQNPLDQLKDIHLPDPISIWPLGIGWWVLMILTLALIAACVWWYKKNQWKRQAKRQLLAIPPAVSSDYYYQVNRLLKQVAVYRFGQSCAHLSGPQWLEYLDSQVKRPVFTSELPEFANAPDDPNAKPDPQKVQRLALTWLNNVRS